MNFPALLRELKVACYILESHFLDIEKALDRSDRRLMRLPGIGENRLDLLRKHFGEYRYSKVRKP